MRDPFASLMSDGLPRRFSGSALMGSRLAPRFQANFTFLY